MCQIYIERTHELQLRNNLEDLRSHHQKPGAHLIEARGGRP